MSIGRFARALLSGLAALAISPTSAAYEGAGSGRIAGDRAKHYRRSSVFGATPPAVDPGGVHAKIRYGRSGGGTPGRAPHEGAIWFGYLQDKEARKIARALPGVPCTKKPRRARHYRRHPEKLCTSRA